MPGPPEMEKLTIVVESDTILLPCTSWISAMSSDPIVSEVERAWGNACRETFAAGPATSSIWPVPESKPEASARSNTGSA